MKGRKDILQGGAGHEALSDFQTCSQMSLDAPALASSPCGMDHIATAPWEYGPEFLSSLDASFSPACRDDDALQPPDTRDARNRAGRT